MENKESNGRRNWMWPRGQGLQPLIPGIVLILLGVIFLLQNVYGLELENWWAVFILFPALGNFVSVYEHYRRSGTFDRPARVRLFWGLFFTLLATAFFLDLDWGLLWPAFLILGGLGLLLGVF